MHTTFEDGSLSMTLDVGTGEEDDYWPEIQSALPIIMKTARTPRGDSIKCIARANKIAKERVQKRPLRFIVGDRRITLESNQMCISSHMGQQLIATAIYACGEERGARCFKCKQNASPFNACIVL